MIGNAACIAVERERSDLAAHHRVLDQIADGIPFGLRRIVHGKVQGQVAQVQLDVEIGFGKSDGPFGRGFSAEQEEFGRFAEQFQFDLKIGLLGGVF